MSFVWNSNLRIAYERSDEVLRNVPVVPGQVVGTDQILDYVRRKYCPVVELYTMSFADVLSDGVSLRDCGAMMRVEFNGYARNATIILNSDKPETFQRFSLMQQIGHLVTIPPDSRINQNNFQVSTQCNDDLSGIREEDLLDNNHLLRETVANIFALRVLMPGELFYQALRELGILRDVAAYFDQTENAVLSRIMIGA